MACRLMNLHSKSLRIDLRGGQVLLLAPGERSAALREELLYDNHHLPDWERLGWIRRFAARLSDVTAEAGVAPAQALVAASSVPTAATAVASKAAPGVRGQGASAEVGKASAKPQRAAPNQPQPRRTK